MSTTWVWVRDGDTVAEVAVPAATDGLGGWRDHVHEWRRIASGLERCRKCWMRRRVCRGGRGAW
jgi:hypothetical protein